jgi:asparagine synthase (glutamine-hydrolysing)
MSGLAAAVRFDGGPPPDAELDAMIAAAPHRRPDGCTTWRGAGAALAKLHRLSLPEQSVAAQPAVGASGLVTIFDGRLDNRRELAARFPAAQLRDDDDDVRHAVAALTAAGPDGVARLEGDFALLAWDPATRTLVAASDALGLRPLYWMVDRGVLLFASDVAQVLAAATQAPRPDDSAITDILRSDPPIDGRTWYAGIRRLLPGEWLRADCGGIRTTRYWRPEARPPERERSDDDYAEECRALLDASVAARLRSRTPVAVFFSGGIDSSSVLASALRTGGDRERIVALSIDYRDAESEERRYRQAFTSHYRIGNVELAPDPFDPSVYIEQMERRRLPPDFPSQFIGRVTRRAAVARGARVALTGEGGDALFSGTPYHYADLIRRGRLVAALVQYGQDARGDDSGWTPAGLLTDGVWPLLPQAWRERLRGPINRVRGAQPAVRWVRREGSPRAAVPDPPRGVPLSTWAIAWDFNRGWTSYFFDMLERDAAEWGLELRHPLVDRRLVDFALSLPETQRCRAVMNKIVLRRAVDLPRAVSARTTKASLGHSLTRALVALGGRPFFERLRLADGGWVDVAEVLRGYDYVSRATIPGDRLAETLLPRLWTVAALELWLQRGLHAERRRAEA